MPVFKAYHVIKRKITGFNISTLAIFYKRYQWPCFFANKGFEWWLSIQPLRLRFSFLFRRFRSNQQFGVETLFQKIYLNLAYFQDN